MAGRVVIHPFSVSLVRDALAPLRRGVPSFLLVNRFDSHRQPATLTVGDKKGKGEQMSEQDRWSYLQTSRDDEPHWRSGRDQRLVIYLEEGYRVLLAHNAQQARVWTPQRSGN